MPNARARLTRFCGVYREIQDRGNCGGRKPFVDGIYHLEIGGDRECHLNISDIEAVMSEEIPLSVAAKVLTRAYEEDRPGVAKITYEALGLIIGVSTGLTTACEALLAILKEQREHGDLPTFAIQEAEDKVRDAIEHLPVLQETCTWKLLDHGVYVPGCCTKDRESVGLAVDSWKVCPRCGRKLVVQE